MSAPTVDVTGRKFWHHGKMYQISKGGCFIIKRMYIGKAKRMRWDEVDRYDYNGFYSADKRFMDLCCYQSVIKGRKYLYKFEYKAHYMDSAYLLCATNHHRHHSL